MECLQLTKADEGNVANETSLALGSYDSGSCVHVSILSGKILSKDSRFIHSIMPCSSRDKHLISIAS
jgi:hypothetical protein